MAGRLRRPALRPRGSRAPEGYPAECERDVTLADGRVVHLRPVVPGDVDELKRAVSEADAETLRRRFLGGRPPAADEEFTRLVTVDYVDRFALVALTDGRVGVGIARYERLVDDEAVADVAVAVDPAWRRVGLATAMLQLLGEAALDRRVERFTLEFLHDNVDVASILKESGLPFARRQAAGVVEAEVALTTDDAPQPAGSAPRV